MELSMILLSIVLLSVVNGEKCRWEDNIKMDLQEIGGGRGDWMELAQYRDRWWALVGTVRDSINAENFLTSCKVCWLASQEGLCSME
jgi:hypothetical protein